MESSPRPAPRPRAGRPARVDAAAGGRRASSVRLSRAGPRARRQEDLAALDVPDTARGETCDREEIGRQEEERVERLVVRIAALDQQAAQLVLAGGDVLERA